MSAFLTRKWIFNSRKDIKVRLGEWLLGFSNYANTVLTDFVTYGTLERNTLIAYIEAKHYTEQLPQSPNVIYCSPFSHSCLAVYCRKL